MILRLQGQSGIKILAPHFSFRKAESSRTPPRRCSQNAASRHFGEEEHEEGPEYLGPGPDTPTPLRRYPRSPPRTPWAFSGIPDTLRQLTYCDSGCKRASADGLNPLTVSQRPSDNYQRNSGTTAMVCNGPPCSMTPNITAIPEAMIRGPPTRPSTAMPRGTRAERYIK